MVKKKKKKKKEKKKKKKKKLHAWKIKKNINKYYQNEIR